jgi:hypothetical protein
MKMGEKVLLVLFGSILALLVLAGVYVGFALIYGLVHDNWRVMGLSALALVLLVWAFTIHYSNFITLLRKAK